MSHDRSSVEAVVQEYFDALYEGNAGIGIATVDLDGNVTFNGSPLTDPEADALAAACDEALLH